MPPPRPSPLEEPQITDDHELNAERFWDQSNWAPSDYFLLPSDQLDRVRKRLRPGQRPRAWNFLRWLLVPRDIASNLGQQDDDATWTVDRNLFEGNSVVGLWVKRDAEQKRVDEILVKETAAFDHAYFSETLKKTGKKKRSGIAMEAVWHLDIQRQERADRPDEEIRNIVHLRGYKYNNWPKQSETPIRLYLTYAPHGTVLDLNFRYQLCGHSVPEAFWWHLLSSVAKACLVFKRPLEEDALYYKTTESSGRSDGDYMLHGDIKHVNVVLDYAPLEDETLHRIYQRLEEPDHFTRIYPVVKLTDFQFMHYAKPDRPFNFIESGTAHWATPEQLKWGKDLIPPPNDYDALEYDSRWEVWQIGKMVYEAAQRPGDSQTYTKLLLKDAVDWDDSQSLYEARNGHFLTDEHLNRIPSAELKALLMRCLHPSVAKRPTMYQLAIETDTWLTAWNRKLRTTATSVDDLKQHRLYYRNNEINELGPGNVMEHEGELAHKDYMKYKYWNPEYPLDITPGRFRRPTPNDKQERDKRMVEREADALGSYVIPLPPPSEAELQAQRAQYTALGMQGLRTEIRARNLDVRLAGKGVTKDSLAKKLVDHDEEARAEKKRKWVEIGEGEVDEEDEEEEEEEAEEEEEYVDDVEEGEGGAEGEPAVAQRDLVEGGEEEVGATEAANNREARKRERAKRIVRSDDEEDYNNEED
ncbi:uncharacterized protein AB675_5468 [Cyphellophora attinorum]|uniref:non-specific serine/threonine protein kinase n=1 Tax=Cyphellophora attinorum TaxID=1664694 RepID=A0A0N1P1D2_9EURO|nr:uncharacterized protein AB675_5468 [Phialophora attinorum]KPI41907.1 hypothetical protein AB675_5468 [Phialophora attinorum]